MRLEDTDPYRDCHQWPVTPRLTAAEAAAWQAQFEEAWRLIEGSYPQYAPGIAAGLSVMLPLANDEPGREISAAAREAFGAVAAALPPVGADLALLIIHEFQHVKLGALIDMFDLYDRDGPAGVLRAVAGGPAAARRPAPGHVRAHRRHRLLAAAARTRSTGPDALAAAEQFARWRMMTAEAIETPGRARARSPPLGDTLRRRACARP